MNAITLLQLLQFADSQVPIGAAAHSLGLETLTAEETIRTESLEEFLEGYLAEAGARDAAYCRDAHRLAALPYEESTPQWLTLNQQLSAWQPARESRAASATLGRRFLQFAAGLSEQAVLREALQAAKETQTEVHHATAFGLVCGVSGLTDEEAALSFLQQAMTAFVSAGQRLLPLGQAQASGILWRLQASAARAATQEVETVNSWTPLLDMASMRHPGLTTRLFIS